MKAKITGAVRLKENGAHPIEEEEEEGGHKLNKSYH